MSNISRKIIFIFLFMSFGILSKEVRVAMVLWRGETPAESSFLAHLKKQGFKVEKTTINADQNRSDLGRKLREMIAEKKYDYIYSFGTTASQMVKFFVNNKIPQIFNIVTDPYAAGLLHTDTGKNSMIAGVTNFVDLDFQISKAQEVIKFKKLGVIFNSEEENSLAMVDKLNRVTEKYGIELIRIRTQKNLDAMKFKIQEIVNKKTKIDALFVPSDSFLISNSKYIATEMNKAKIPTVGAVSKLVEDGLLIGTISHYEQLGKLAAEILIKHYNGQSLSSLPLQSDNSPEVYINRKTLEILGIKLSKDMQKNIKFIK